MSTGGRCTSVAALGGLSLGRLAFGVGGTCSGVATVLLGVLGSVVGRGGLFVGGLLLGVVGSEVSRAGNRPWGE
jgi:hypothetical protein